VRDVSGIDASCYSLTPDFPQGIRDTGGCSHATEVRPGVSELTTGIYATDVSHPFSLQLTSRTVQFAVIRCSIFEKPDL